MQVEPSAQGRFTQGSISTEQLSPPYPFGQLHLYSPMRSTQTLPEGHVMLSHSFMSISHSLPSNPTKQSQYVIIYIKMYIVFFLILRTKLCVWWEKHTFLTFTHKVTLVGRQTGSVVEARLGVANVVRTLAPVSHPPLAAVAHKSVHLVNAHPSVQARWGRAIVNIDLTVLSW